MLDLATFALGACLAVGPASDQVLAGDLAAAAPEWSAIPADTPLALAPAPGVQRVFHLPELRRMALRWNLAAPPGHEICVTRPSAVSDSAELLAAMRRTLPDARIEIVDFSRQPAPQGEIEFPLAALHQSNGGAFWTGYVKYGGRQRFALWARVKVLAAVTRVIAAEDLKPGRALEASALRLDSREEFPDPGYAARIEDIAGKVSRRSIAAGTPLRVEWLEPPKAVTRGDAVQVEIVSGAAHLKLEGLALSSGAVGDSILVLNPDSRRQFRARIQSPGKVLVTWGNPEGNS
jgi:flagella basal body P-ring formation protein FlgA